MVGFSGATLLLCILSLVIGLAPASSNSTTRK